jgi:hypothetical protein
MYGLDKGGQSPTSGCHAIVEEEEGFSKEHGEDRKNAILNSGMRWIQ